MGGRDSDDETAIGACALYSTDALMRRVAHNGPAMTSFMRAMLASAKHVSARAQAAVTETLVVFLVRVSGPEPGAERTPEYAETLEAIGNTLSAEGARAPHWRYTIMANAFLLLLTGRKVMLPLPGAEFGGGASPPEHFLRNLSGELPFLRQVSAVALLRLLQRGPHSTVQPSSPAKPTALTGTLSENFSF